MHATLRLSPLVDDNRLKLQQQIRFDTMDVNSSLQRVCPAVSV